MLKHQLCPDSRPTQLDERLLLSALFFLHFQHHTGSDLAEQCVCVCCSCMRLSPRAPTVPQMQTSSCTLESNLSSIFHPFALHLVCPGSSLTFANETHPRADPASCSDPPRRRRWFPAEMAKDRSVSLINL